MQDIESIRRYWESELELGGRHGESVPIVTSPVETMWMWSDLHLSDRGALEAFDRGFADVAAMNRNLLAAWRQRVWPGDTIICLGDVAHPDAWRDRRLVLDLRACPGERIPILGNHDLNRDALRGYREIAIRDREHIRRAELLLRAAYDDLHGLSPFRPGRPVVNAQAVAPPVHPRVSGDGHDEPTPTRRRLPHLPPRVRRW